MSGSASPQDIETLFQLIYLNFTAPRADENAFLAFKQQVQASLENRGASPRSAFGDTVSVTMSQHHFRTRPFTTAVIDEMDLETSFAVYSHRIADAGDFTFAFVGNFEVENMRGLVETYLGGLPSTGREETWRDVGIDPPKGVIRKTVRRGVEPQSQTRIIFTGDASFTRQTNHVLRSTAAVLETWLRETLREALGGTYSVNVSASVSRRPEERYRINVSFGSAPERADELAGVVFHHIDSLRTVGPSADDVLKVQESQRRAREISLRENGYWVGQMIAHARDGIDQREILTVEEFIDALDPEVIRDTAARFFDMENYVHAVLLPAEGPVN